MRLDIDSVIGCATRAAEQAGRLIVEQRRKHAVQTSYKNDVEPLTTADLAADDLIGRTIRAAFPQHFLLSEESAESGWSQADWLRPLWVVDPIDGTANYSRGHPYVSVSVAFAVHGIVQAAAVHAPFLGETFTAVKGGGARLNGEVIRVAQPESLRRAVVSTGFPHSKTSLPPLLRRVEKILTHCQDIRRAASPALDICWVGAGRLDAHTESLHPWDVAAASLIATEAGALRSHLEPVPTDVPPDLFGGGLLVSAPAIHGRLRKLLEEEGDPVS